MREITPTDSYFAPDEPLYRRLPPTACTPQANQVPLDIIQFPRCSVNRARFSKPEDVLLPDWLDHGIAEFPAGAVPAEITSDTSAKTFWFKVVYDPVKNHPTLPDNPAHSEIRCYADEACTNEPKNVTKDVKLEFRTTIWQHARIHEPRQVQQRGRFHHGSAPAFVYASAALSGMLPAPHFRGDLYQSWRATGRRRKSWVMPKPQPSRSSGAGAVSTTLGARIAPSLHAAGHPAY
ncbi:MAG TPA: hypothetical protein VE913_14620 [Longimicrobium sp.]|nr:hypothetical protein [Longimicrobium sp.]